MQRPPDDPRRPDGLIRREAVEDDRSIEPTLRPQCLNDFVGQVELKAKVRLLIEAAGERGEAIDHVLLSGPPGLGKTTMAQIIAAEMGTGFVPTSGPVIERAGDLAGLLTRLRHRDVLFIDEIHRLNHVVEEYLYPAMEDYRVDIMIDSGPAAKLVTLNLERFTLIGATTRTGLLTAPLLTRFGFSARIDYYEPIALAEVVRRTALKLEVEIDERGAFELARRSRGTPRVANRLLRRVRDFAQMRASGVIDRDVACQALELLGVDDRGLEEMDRRILETLIDKYDGGPVGLGTLAVSVGEEPDTIEEVYEPFLIELGFVERTRRGRVACRRAYEHLRRPAPPTPEEPEPPQGTLL